MCNKCRVHSEVAKQFAAFNGYPIPVFRTIRKEGDNDIVVFRIDNYDTFDYEHAAYWLTPILDKHFAGYSDIHVKVESWAMLTPSCRVAAGKESLSYAIRDTNWRLIRMATFPRSGRMIGNTLIRLRSVDMRDLVNGIL